MASPASDAVPELPAFDLPPSLTAPLAPPACCPPDEIPPPVPVLPPIAVAVDPPDAAGPPPPPAGWLLPAPPRSTSSAPCESLHAASSATQMITTQTRPARSRYPRL